MKPIKIKVVVATRISRQDFFTRTATGRSLALFGFPFLELNLFAENSRGLPEIYNAVIESSRQDPAILIFVHDDVHFLDYYWIQNVLEGLQHFPIIGIAGNRRRVARQPAWAFVDEHLTWDEPENLSGVVAHGRAFPPDHLAIFGRPGMQVKLLDGLFIATSSQALLEHDLRFDERFAFHFYDLDFCRQAEQKGLPCGTWSISLMHESAGNFRSEAWEQAYRLYLDKWKS